MLTISKCNGPNLVEFFCDFVKIPKIGIFSKFNFFLWVKWKLIFGIRFLSVWGKFDNIERVNFERGASSEETYYKSNWLNFGSEASSTHRYIKIYWKKLYYTKKNCRISHILIRLVVCWNVQNKKTFLLTNSLSFITVVWE